MFFTGSQSWGQNGSSSLVKVGTESPHGSNEEAEIKEDECTTLLGILDLN